MMREVYESERGRAPEVVAAMKALDHWFESVGDDLGGIAVHIAARVASLAGPGEVLVSSTVKDLVAGSGLRFVDRGMHRLKGVPEEWRLFAVDLTSVAR